MFITRLHIGAFGPFTDRTIDQISPGLTVIHGPNKAGKSALRAFLRYVLFGWPRKNAPGMDAYRYEPERGGEPSGNIGLRDSAGRSYTIHRRGVAQTRSGSVTGDMVGGEDALEKLLGRVGMEVYQNVYSISLTELERLDLMSDKDVGNRIYSAGLGMGAVGLSEGLKANEADLKKIRGKRDGGTLRKVESELLKKTQERERALTDLGNYESLIGQDSGLEVRIGEQAERLTKLREESARYTRLEDLRAPWNKQAELRRTLAELPCGDGYPVNGLEAFGELVGEEKGLAKQIADGDEERRQRRQEREGLEIKESFTQHADEIRRLTHALDHYQSAADDLPKTEAELQLEEAQLGEKLSALGPGWDEGRLAAGVDISGLQSIVPEAGGRLNTARVDLRFDKETARQRSEEERTARVAYDEALLRLDAPAGGPRAEVADLRQRETRLKRLQAAAAEHSDVDRRLIAITMGLLAVPAGAGALPLIGPLLAFVGRLARAAWRRLLGLAGRTGQGAPTVPDDPSQELRTKREELRLRLRKIELELSGLLKPLGLDETPSDRDRVELINRTSLEIAAREAHDRLMSASDQAARASSASQRSAAEAAAAEEAWRDVMEATGFERGLPLVDASIKVGSIEGLIKQQNINDGLKTRIHDMSWSVGDIEGRLTPVLQASGQPGFEPRHAAPSLKQLAKLFSLHEKALEQARALDGSDASWDSRRSALSKSLSDVRSLKATVLERAGVNSEEEYLELGRKLGERQKLEDRLADLRQNQSLLVNEDGREYVKMLAEVSYHQAQARIADLEQEITKAEEERDELRGDRQSVQERKQRLEESNPVGKLQLEIGELQERRDEDAGRWAVLTIAKWLIESTRDEFQNTRQTPLFQAATRWFAALTREGYSSVQALMGEGQRVRVIDSRGRNWDHTALSRATKEQLYLAMRFALIEEYARTTEPLPVLMDDVMVNFDPAHSRTACSAIADLSLKHQVIVLTCHPQTVAALKDAAPALGADGGFRVIDLGK